MIGRLKDMVKDREGNWVISFTTKERIDGDRFDELAKYDCDIEIKRHRNIRSKTANAYFHVLVNKIAAETIPDTKPINRIGCCFSCRSQRMPKGSTSTLCCSMSAG